ncbi:MAG TPA: DEAD/DEAH box helicase, partial [Thermoanaerobaculia bacterium]|nr:DEAD/DEAH box helicase [Thermoanaerobaculia bacterium]
DAPLAERRAQALAIDQSQLRELLGEPELRELLDPASLEEIERALQHLTEGRKARSADALHDLLLRLGDLSTDQIEERAEAGADPAAWVEELVRARRILPISITAEKRFIAVEDASRYRDALGVPLPTGIPERYLERVADPVGDLVLRYARTHGPFAAAEPASRYGLGIAVVTSALERYVERGRIVEGEFRPNGTQREFCEADVLRSIRRRSLAKLRKEVEPVEQPVLARLFTHWQGIARKRRGLEALLESVEMLQGYPMAASIFEREILAARIDEYRPSDLDMLSAAGEIVWVGVEPLGGKDGRIALYLTDHLPVLHAPRVAETPRDALGEKIVEFLRANGASFFAQIQMAVGGFQNEVIDALWDLVWRGDVTNDTFHALRAFTRPKAPARSGGFRSRRVAPPSTQGRWSIVGAGTATATLRATSVAQQLLNRYGVVTREAPGAENISGGFGAVYPVLKAMEEGGKVRRGYFVAGLGATQFASAGALDRLRSLREDPEEPETVMIAATDPANPYGAILKWPEGANRTFSRSVGPRVIFVNGRLVCYVGRGEKQLTVLLPDDEPSRSVAGREIARALASMVTSGARRALLITEVNDEPVARSAMAPFLVEAGFMPSALGYQLRAAHA